MKQGTIEWLEQRKKSVTGTDIPILMGENPFKTPFKLWEEKTNRRAVYETEAMRVGRALESEIRRLYEEKTGTAIFVPDAEIHPYYPDFMVSIDGESFDGMRIVEFKSCNDKTWEIVKSGELPRIYYGQCQWQMFHRSLSEMHCCFGLKEYDLILNRVVVKEIHILIVMRDQEYILQAVDKAGEFLKYLRTDTPPPTKEFDITVTDEQFKLFSQYLSMLEQKNHYDEVVESLKNEIIKSCGGKNTEAAGLKIEKITRRGSPNYDNIPELKNVNLDQYRKPDVEYWKISTI